MLLGKRVLRHENSQKSARWKVAPCVARSLLRTDRPHIGNRGGLFREPATEVLWALRKGVFGPLERSRTWTSFFEKSAYLSSQKRCPWPRDFSEKSSLGMSRPCPPANAMEMDLGGAERAIGNDPLYRFHYPKRSRKPPERCDRKHGQ